MYNPLEMLKDLKDKTGLALKELTVLAPQNDPFRIGTEGQIRDAEWFVDQWHQGGFTAGTHIRRVHYYLQSFGDMKKPNGQVYRNTKNDSAWLNNVTKHARIMGMLNPYDFEDRRNPPPTINYNPDRAGPWIQQDDPCFLVPVFEPPTKSICSIDEPCVQDFYYRSSDQPYLVEIWIEKSTMDGELKPLCSRYNINLVGGKGFQSHTSVLAFIERCKEANKPGRILYISDFDPAGNDMPTAIARFLEFKKQEYAPSLDIALQPIALTAEQVIEYDLPTDPDKSTDKFLAIYGQGAVELDALAALHPGEFEKIVEEHINLYLDHEIEDEISSVESDEDERLYEEWADHIGDLPDRMDDLQSDIEEVYEQFDEPLKKLFEEVNETLEPYRERAKILENEALQMVSDFNFIMEDRPETSGEVEATFGVDHYFDSERSYLEQLSYHKKRKVG